MGVSRKTYEAADLLDFVKASAQALGVPPQDATILAQHLVDAELRGHQSHGVSRLLMYSERIRQGTMTPVTQLETVSDSGTVVVLDGHDGIGQVIALKAAQLAVERARKHGLAAVGVRYSNHFGTAAYYSREIASHKCLGLITTNASPAMAPWGGKAAAVGNNPWSIAAPAGRYGEVVLDIANTVVARGKIREASREGRSIPPGWALDAEGRETTDPDAALAGMVLPIGGHKGYGISFMMDVLAGVLTGSASGQQVSGSFEADRRSGVGPFCLALDIARFLDVEVFEARMEQLVDELKAVPTADRTTEILYPGEPEQRALEQSKGVVSLSDEAVEQLAALGSALGVEFPEAVS